MTEKLVKGDQESKIVFNPEADYQWKANDSFVLRGKELEVLHSTLGTIFGTNIPAAQMYLMLNECFKITTNLIQRNVENGSIREVPQEESVQQN